MTAAPEQQIRRRVHPVADATKIVNKIEKIDNTGRTIRTFISLPRIVSIHGKVESK